MKKSSIALNVVLDDNNVPEQMEWSATEQAERKSAKACYLSIWDEAEKNTLRLDLWTKEMQVDEMKMFTYQSLLTMADSFERATGETQMAAAMRDFSDYFSEKMKLDQP